MRRLAVVLVALGLVIWIAAPALSVGPFVPTAVEFAQTPPPGTTSAGRGAAGWRSGVVVAPERFDLVGLTWRATGRVRARIRVRSAGGRWSAWTAMDAGDGSRPGAEPVWAGGADAYELRLDRRPAGLRAHFVNATGTATATDRVTTALRRAAHGALALQITRQGSDGAMHVVARLPVPVRNGRYAIRVRLRRPALHRLRITSAGDERNAAGRSGDLVLRAVRPRH